MGLFSFLNGPAFLLALGVGLLATYMTVPPPKIVIKFPTPFNAGRVVYAGSPGEEGEKDSAGASGGNGPHECYKYKATVVDCKDYPGKVKPQPLTLGAAVSVENGVATEGFGAR